MALLYYIQAMDSLRLKSFLPSFSQSVIYNFINSFI